VLVRIMDAPGQAETGAGEVAQGPVVGAIGNAVADAVGIRVRDLPLTRERVARAIQGQLRSVMRIDVHADREPADAHYSPLARRHLGRPGTARPERP
jgi:hypothetical protein